MANQNNSNFMDTLLDAQKTAMDTVVENTKKFANGNTIVNETVNKSSEWYKNWLDNQKNVFGQTTQKANDTAEKVQAGASQANEFFQNWYNSQMNNTKQMWDMNLNWMKNFQNQAATTASNPMEAMQQNWNNMTSQYTNWMNNMTAANNWNNMMSQFQSSNPFNMDSLKNVGQNMTGFFNQWTELLNNSTAEWQKNLQAGTIQDAYRNMVSNTEGFTKFYQLWMPMWKSTQEKSFNMDAYKKMMNPAQYKELMDKFFGFLPENTRGYMQQMTETFQNNMKGFSTNGAAGFNQMRDFMSQMMPVNTNEIFGSMMTGYNNMYAQFQNAVSPIARMVTPNKYTKLATEWQDLANRMMVYNIKNSEMQYMMYTQGTKVMDKLAENVQSKIQNGEEISSIMDLYKEWMSISDKSFVELFESDEYSQVMAEVSAMQLKLRKDMEGLMEKAIAPLPIATRSEMDELYKTIYDLKKEVRQLEKMMEFTSEDEAPVTITHPSPEVTSSNDNAAAPKAGAGRPKKS